MTAKTNKNVDDLAVVKLTMDITLAGEAKRKGDEVKVDKATADWLAKVTKKAEVK